MSRTDLTALQKASVLFVVMCLLALVIGVGLLLREHGPGNMGTGFLQGAGIGVVAVVVMTWRIMRNPDGLSTFERAFLQQGDERDDAVLTRALAALGLLALPLTGAATIAIGLGAHVFMTLFVLLIAQIGVGAVAFAVIARRS